MDGFFPLFPYLLIYHTEEVEGLNPATSTGIPPIVEDTILISQHMRDMYYCMRDIRKSCASAYITVVSQ